MTDEIKIKRERYVDPHTYYSKYEGEVRDLFIELANGGTLKSFAAKIGVTYCSLFVATKKGYISRGMLSKIRSNVSLTEEQDEKLVRFLEGV